MQDVEKTEILRKKSPERKRRRNRRLPFYYIIVLVLVVTIMIALCRSYLFNIRHIDLKGELTEYDSSYIVDKSGVKIGDNLMKLDEEEVRENLLNNLVWAEDVTITKNYRKSTLEMDITPCVATANLTDEKGVLIVSAGGRILENGQDAQSDLTNIVGFSPEQRTVGEEITSTDSQKVKIYNALSPYLKKDALEYPITSVDMTDKYNIVLELDGRILFKIGNWSDIDYKVKMGEVVMGKLGDEDTGYLTMVGDNQCSYRTKDNEENSAVMQMQETTVATDAYGNEIIGDVGETTTQTTTEAAAIVIGQ